MACKPGPVLLSLITHGEAEHELATCKAMLHATDLFKLCDRILKAIRTHNLEDDPSVAHIIHIVEHVQGLNIIRQTSEIELMARVPGFDEKQIGNALSDLSDVAWSLKADKTCGKISFANEEDRPALRKIAQEFRESFGRDEQTGLFRCYRQM